MKLTDGLDGTTLVDDTESGRVVDGLVVGLDAPAPGVVQAAVSGVLGSLVETVQRALGEVVGTVLGNHELGGDGSKGQNSSLHLGGGRSDDQTRDFNESDQSA